MARLWHTLEYSGILWHTLAYSSILWHTLAYTDILWHTLAYSCILWHTLAYSGILWHALAYSGIISASLITADGAYHSPVGSIWPFFYLIGIYNKCMRRPWRSEHGQVAAKVRWSMWMILIRNSCKIAKKECVHFTVTCYRIFI